MGLYTVEEDDGDVTVCVQITDGCLERYAYIGYKTVDGTAQCKCMNNHMQRALHNVEKDIERK